MFEIVDTERHTELPGHQATVANSALGDVFTSGEPRIVPSLWGTGDSSPIAWVGEAPAELKELGSAVLVPLAAGQHVLGVLVVAKHSGQIPFLETDLQMVQTFAAHAALAIEFARAQEDRQRLAVFEDRDRIARDLHDLVIQRLFAVGLGLQGMSRLIDRPELSNRIAGYVDDLDHTVRDIRRSIFSLQQPPETPISLRSDLLHIVQEAGKTLGYEPTLAMHGPLDSLVPEEVRPDLLATLREALSNIIRHADAGSVQISVTIDADDHMLRLIVHDDGVGMPEFLEHRRGLANIAERANRWDGHSDIGSAPGAGTTVTWAVPLNTR